SLTYLVEPGHLSLPDVVRLLTSGAAEVIASPNRPAGLAEIKAGSRADITVFDPSIEWVVDPAELLSKSKNTPYGGYRLRGKVRHVLVNGEKLL
ncbi:MAG: dihydroorotase, partial [Chloroflexi bacterium]|nr:dihydroorotase [Chloroflexota bacterium]